MSDTLAISSRVVYVDYHSGYLTHIGTGEILALSGTDATVRFDADGDFFDTETITDVPRAQLEPELRITFPYLDDGFDAADEITATAESVGARIVEHDGADFVIDFPDRNAALAFLHAALPDRDDADYDAIIAERNSTTY